MTVFNNQSLNSKFICTYFAAVRTVESAMYFSRNFAHTFSKLNTNTPLKKLNWSMKTEARKQTVSPDDDAIMLCVGILIMVLIIISCLIASSALSSPVHVFTIVPSNDVLTIEWNEQCVLHAIHTTQHQQPDPLKTIPIADMSCTNNARNQPLFCVFFLPKHQNNSIDLVLTGAHNNEPKQVSTSHLPTQALTIHLLFDYPNKKLRVIILPQTGDIIQRTEPMGITNAGNTCYMNALFQCLVAAPGLMNLVRTHVHYGIAEEYDMFVEIMKTYLNVGYSGIINRDTFKYYILVLTDFCGRRRGAPEQATEMLPYFARIPILNTNAMYYALQPGTLAQPEVFRSKDVPSTLILTLERNRDHAHHSRAIDNKDIANYTLERSRPGESVYQLSGKVQYNGAHYWALTKWNQTWYKCNDGNYNVYQGDVSTITRCNATMPTIDAGLFFTLKK
eukprot:271504_1